jgi:hypothetical protein
MLRRAALVRTDIWEVLSASIMWVTRTGEVGRTLNVTGVSSQSGSVAGYGERFSLFTDSCHPDEGGAKFLQNSGTYKSHTA